MELCDIIKKNQTSIINNFVVYTNDQFKNKWLNFNIDRIDNNLSKKFLLDLVDEIKSINKYLLKSLFIFSKKKNILFLSNLIYLSDKNNFNDPLKYNFKKSKPIPINYTKHKNTYFIISSCFTPPNFTFNTKSWLHRPINNLDEILSCSY